MEPNHWSNLNPQYAARLSAGGVPANPGPLPFLDQHTLAAGLGALSTSLSPHSSLASHITGLPAMSYSHALPGSAMTQILDSLTGQAYTPGQVPYKTVNVGQPAYTLDSPGRTASETVASRFSMQNPQAKLSLFNTDPHTMKEPSHSPVASPPTTSEPSKTWGVAGYMPSGTFFTMSGEAVMTGSNSHGSPVSDPPPAHMGHIRVSSVQKLSFESKPEYSTSASQVVQPPQAHNNVFGVEMPRSHLLEDMLKPSSRPPVVHSNGQEAGQATSPVETPRGITTNQQGYQDLRQALGNPHCIERSQSISSHSSFSETSPSLPNQQTSYPNSPHLQNQAVPSPSSHPQQMAKVSHVPQPQANYSSYNSTMGSYTSNVSSNTMNYDPISPSAVDPESQSLSLHDFADISSHQSKIPMSTAHNPTVVMPSALQQQTVQVSTGSTDPISSSRSSIHPIPIQAVADSTTKPKRGGRKVGSACRNNKNTVMRKNKKNHSQDEVHGTIQIVETVPRQEFTVGLVEACPPGTNNYGVISASPMVLTQMTAPAMSQPTLISQQHVVTPDHPIFLTNSYGGTFINPEKNSSISRSQMAEVQPGSGEGENPLIDPTHEAMFSPLSPKQKYRTKAEQKQMPAVTTVESVDDEFAHLTEEPKLPIKENKLKRCFHLNTVINPTSGGISQDNPLTKQPNSDVPGVSPNPPKTKPGKDFQSSFLSFLQGHKAETLSSVTNSAITVKPELPKYIPDPRPRIMPTTPTMDEDKKDSSNSKIASIGSVAYSDDDSEPGKNRKNLLKAVGKGISELSDNSMRAHKTSGRGRPAQRRRQTPLSARLRGQLEREGLDKHSSGTREDMKWDIHELLPPREKVTRRAKQKAAEKRKSKKKKRRRFYSDESSDYDDNDDDYVELTSSSDLEEKDYDSDKDPVWMPCEQDAAVKASKRRASSLSDDDGDSKKFRSRSKRGHPGSGRRGRPSLYMSTVPVVECSPSPFRPRPITEELLQFLSDDDEITHMYEKGYFVIDRRDLTKYDSYPIWKIDAGSLLQKYEPVMRDGTTIHKSLCTYSSWSENIRERYKAIGVRWIQRSKERDKDLVEVLDQFKPRPVEDKLEEEPLMQAFNVYVQILVSQALEPGFLSAIKSEEDDYYSGPTKTIDSLLDKKKKALVEKIKWTSNFQASVERYPYLSTGEEPDSSTQSRPMLKAVQLSGKPYVRDTLEECSPTYSPDTRTSKEFLVSSKTATLISIYHSLHHFKHTLHKRCCSKVMLLRGKDSKDQSDILDQCLQNRAWVHKLYHNFRQLLEKASTVLESSSSLATSPSVQKITHAADSSASQTSHLADSSVQPAPGMNEPQPVQEAAQDDSEGTIPLSAGDTTQPNSETDTQQGTEDDPQLGSEDNIGHSTEDGTRLVAEETMQLVCEDDSQETANDIFTEDAVQMSVQEQSELAAGESTHLVSEEHTLLGGEDSVHSVSEDRTKLLGDGPSPVNGGQKFEHEEVTSEGAAGQ